MGAGKSVKRLCPYGEEIRGLAVSLPVCRVIRNGGFWLLEASVGMTLSAGMHIRRGAGASLRRACLAAGGRPPATKVVPLSISRLAAGSSADFLLLRVDSMVYN